jgi:hypothetical protein
LKAVVLSVNANDGVVFGRIGRKSAARPCNRRKQPKDGREQMQRASLFSGEQKAGQSRSLSSFDKKVRETTTADHGATNVRPVHFG